MSQFCTVFKGRLEWNPDVQQDSVQDGQAPKEISPPIAQSRQWFL